MSGKDNNTVLEVGILDLLWAVVKRKKFVLTLTLAAALLSTATVFLIPLKWKSESLLLPVAENGGLSQIGQDLLGGWSNFSVATSERKDIALELLTIMDSRTFREDVIRKFNLIKYFRIKDPDSTVAMDRALKKYNDRIFTASLEPQSNSVSMAVSTRDKYLSKHIAEYIIHALENYLKRDKKTKNRMLREFLEQRTNELQARLDTLLVVKKMLESEGKAVALTEQTNQALKLYSDLVTQLFINEIELELARSRYGKDSPQIKELESKSILLKQKIDAFERGSGNKLPKYILNLDKLPQITLDYSRIQMEIDVINQIYNNLSPILETARLNEIKEMPQFDVIDRPYLAGLHAYPKRLLVISLLTVAALLFASLLAVIDEFMSEENRKLLGKIRVELTIRKKR